jgi:O-antigen/teichoic acid export membrane protein
LEIICITYLFYGIQAVIYSLLQAIGRTVHAMITGIVAALADIAFALTLIPKFGMIGGAASRSLEAAIGMVVCIYFARPYFKRLDKGRFYLKAIIASVIPFVLVYLLTEFVSGRTLTLIPYSIIGLGVFFGCLKILKVFTDEDRSFIAHLTPLKLQKLLKYI